MKRTERPILVASINTALDRVLALRQLQPGGVHRVSEHDEAGGKSLNVARALVRHGETVRVVGFVGGATGAWVRDRVSAQGIEAAWVQTQGASRTCDIIVETVGPRSTVLNGEGPPISGPEAAALETQILRHLQKASFLVLTGSLCPGLPDDLYARWARLARTRAIAVAVDAHGPVLRLAVEAAPQIVKVNEDELRETFGEDSSTVANRLLARGARWVIVTRGEEGALGFCHEGSWQVPAPRVEVRNATGSGDAFLAGVVSAWLRGLGLEAALTVGAAAGAANAANLVAGIPPDANLKNLASGLVPKRVDR